MESHPCPNVPEVLSPGGDGGQDRGDLFSSVFLLTEIVQLERIRRAADGMSCSLGVRCVDVARRDPVTEMITDQTETLGDVKARNCAHVLVFLFAAARRHLHYRVSS